MPRGLTMTQECSRCGSEAERLYTIPLKNEDDEIINHRLCWSCDWDIMNGGNIEDEAGDILMDREENAYEYDPINVPRPSWYP